MPHATVTIDTAFITDWESFHNVFAGAFGFPRFYGRNLNAWIDCLSSLDAPEDGMTTIHAPPGGVLLLNPLHMRDLASRCPDTYAAIIKDTAFINFRKMELGQPPVLCLSFYDSGVWQRVLIGPGQVDPTQPLVRPCRANDPPLASMP